MSRPVGIEIFYWLDTWADDQASVFSKAAEAGYDGVEISLVAGLEMDIRHIGDVANEHGLDVLCSTGLSADADISSPDASVRAAGVDHLRRSLEQAAELRSPILGGVTYAPWMGFPDGDLDGHRKRSAESLHEVAAHAETLGIHVCLEVLNRFETYMFNTVADCLRFIATVDHPSIKVELDTFHMNMEEDDLGTAVLQAGDQIGHVQVAANNRRAPQYGHIDWGAFKAALDTVGYDGWIVFETFPNPLVETGRDTYAWRALTFDPDRDAADAARFMRENLS